MSDLDVPPQMLASGSNLLVLHYQRWVQTRVAWTQTISVRALISYHILGPKQGYHVIRVAQKSPAQYAGL